MRSPRLLLGTLGSVAAAATLVAATALPASAAGPYTVATGIKTTGTSAYTGATTGTSPQIKFVANGVQLGCNSGTANGAIKNGTSATGAKIATITSTTWVGCTGPGGLPLTVTQVGTWYINGSGAVQDNLTLPGRLNSINAHVSAANASQCNFDVAGFVKGKLFQRPNTAQTLQVLPNGGGLVVSNVVGCFGLIPNGTIAQFSATYGLTTPDGPIKIRNG